MSEFNAEAPQLACVANPMQLGYFMQQYSCLPTLAASAGASVITQLLAQSEPVLQL